MAEIHVEKKRGSSLIVWVLLLVIVAAAIVAYCWYAGYIHLGAIAHEVQKLALTSAGGINGV